MRKLSPKEVNNWKSQRKCQHQGSVMGSWLRVHQISFSTFFCYLSNCPELQRGSKLSSRRPCPSVLFIDRCAMRLSPHQWNGTEVMLKLLLLLLMVKFLQIKCCPPLLHTPTRWGQNIDIYQVSQLLLYKQETHLSTGTNSKKKEAGSLVASSSRTTSFL